MYVSPIAEENERGSLGSFASSNVIPSAIPDYYYEEAESPDDNEEELSPDYEKEEPVSNDDSEGLVSKASLGKRHKPSLTR